MPVPSAPHPPRRAFAPPGRRRLAIAVLLAGGCAVGAVSGVLGFRPGSAASASTRGAEQAGEPRVGVPAIRRVDAVAPGKIMDAAEATATAPAPATSAPRRVPSTASWPTHNFLLSADGTLHTGVGLYTDCSGNTPLPGGQAAIDTCTSRVTYFVGHNVGVFTPLMHMGVGAMITWWDSNGTAHPLRVVSVRNWSHGPGFPTPARSDVIAQFQTCITADGSLDRVLDAVAA